MPYGRKSPLCGSRTTESARSIPAIASRPRAVSRKNPPYAAVDVEPEALARAEVRQRGEVVDGSRVRRPGVPADEEGREPGRAVRRDPPGEEVDPDPEPPVGRDRPDVLRREPRERRGLRDRVVRLVGDVERPLQEVGGELLPPRRDDGREGGERASRREVAAAPLREARDAAEPRITFVSSWTSAGAACQTPA